VVVLACWPKSKNANRGKKRQKEEKKVVNKGLEPLTLALLAPCSTD
jgi:hypothetical protein